MRRVVVVWEDASDADDGPWVDRGTAAPAEAIIFHQVGFVQSMTSTEIVLTACVGVHQMGARTRIPAGMVRSIIELVDGKPISLPRPRRKRS